MELKVLLLLQNNVVNKFYSFQYNELQPFKQRGSESFSWKYGAFLVSCHSTNSTVLQRVNRAVKSVYIHMWPSAWSALSSNHEVSTIVTSYFLSNLVCTYISQDDIRFHVVILLCSVELGWHVLLCDTEQRKIEFSNISPDKNSKWNTSSAKDDGANRDTIMGFVISQTQSLIFRINFTGKWNVWQDTEVIFKRAIDRSDLNLTYQLKDSTSYHVASKITLQWQHQIWGKVSRQHNNHLVTFCSKSKCIVKN